MRALHASPVKLRLLLFAAALVSACTAEKSVGVEPRATELAFLTTPSHVTPSNLISPGVVVVARDASGQIDTTFADTVRIASVPIAGIPFARLEGTTKVKAVAGVATFDELFIVVSADGYRLTATASSLPSVTTEPFDVNQFQTLAAGADHFCLITDRSKTYCWGLNARGQLGDGSTTTRAAPVRVASGLAFDSLAAGEHHTCALTAAGAAYCWGRNDNGQLGDGTSEDRSVPVAVTGGQIFVDIVAGGAHTCGLTAAGAAYCWGWNAVGEAGVRSVPTLVPSPTTFTRLAARRQDTCAMAADGNFYCWTAVGLTIEPNLYGASDAETHWGGFDRMCYRRVFPDIYCWTTDPSAPVLSAIPTFTQQLTIGNEHTCVATLQGEAICWGANNHGQVGDGTRTTRALPTNIQSAMGGYATFKIAASANATCALAEKLRCWGSNAHGQLGLGITENPPADRLVPTIAAFP